MLDKPYIFDLTPPALRELAVQWGLPPYRADQVLEWVYRKQVGGHLGARLSSAASANAGAPGFDARAPGDADGGRDARPTEGMTNISQADRRTLAANLRFTAGQVVREQIASDGVRKLLIEWDEESLRPIRPRAEPSSRGVPRLGGALAARCVVPEHTLPPPESRLDRDGQSVAPTPRDARPETRDAPGLSSPADPSSRQTECVMIPAGEGDEEGQPERRTACVSSQVGCAVGCRFCASGLGGLDANLSAGQIVEQVWRLGGGERVESGEERVEQRVRKRKDPHPYPFPQKGEGVDQPKISRISHVVFMGMGEPLANFAQVTRAVGTLMADWGLGISGRRITISTVGLPAQIRRLADLALPVTLAISLHAPNDDLRRRLIPWARFVSIAQLVAAGRDYFDKTGREVTLEYILLGGVNDRAEHAAELATVARQLRSNVNLIRYNEVAGMPFTRPADRDVRQFQDILRRAGVNTHVRASRGRDIAAACGQLRHEHGGQAI